MPNLNYFDMARKAPHEKGYTIPVMRKISTGRYSKAFAKTLTGDKNGRVRVCFDSGRTSRWGIDSIIHVPQGFKPRADALRGDE